MKTILGSRRHHYMARVSIFLLTVALIAGMVGCSARTPTTEIRTWYDLDAIRNNLGGNYTLMNDLNSTTAGYTKLASPTANAGMGWQPIGTLFNGNVFIGTFNGQGYEIGDLFIGRLDEDFVGLFGYVGEGGVIKNLGVVNVVVSGSDYVGSLVGWNNGTVSNSYSIGSVTGSSGEVGGLVGLNAGTVSNAYSAGSVSSSYFITDEVGGLVGGNGGNVSNAYSTGTMYGNNRIGGLVGKNYEGGTVSNAYSTGNVSGEWYVGGLVGYSDGTASDSYSTGSVTGHVYVGGLVGGSNGTVSNSFWDTETSGQATSDGGTGKNTTEMQDIATFSGAVWNIIAVANSSTRNLAYLWNIVNNVTYPFLSWQPT